MSNVLIEPEIREKIIAKIYGMGIVRGLNGQKSSMSIPEFKFIIGRWRIKKKMWFKIAKDLEKENLIEMRACRLIIINCRNIRKRKV